MYCSEESSVVADVRVSSELKSSAEGPAAKGAPWARFNPPFAKRQLFQQARAQRPWAVSADAGRRKAGKRYGGSEWAG